MKMDAKKFQRLFDKLVDDLTLDSYAGAVSTENYKRQEDMARSMIKQLEKIYPGDFTRKALIDLDAAFNAREMAFGNEMYRQGFKDCYMMLSLATDPEERKRMLHDMSQSPILEDS